MILDLNLPSDLWHVVMPLRISLQLVRELPRYFDSDFFAWGFFC